MNPQQLSAEQRPDGWDAAVSHYEDTTERVTGRFAAKMLEYATIGPGVELLDVAAGAGVVAIEAARRGASVLAADFSPQMVQRLEERLAGEGLTDVRAAVMDGQALDLPDGSRDVVTCNFGIMFFPDPKAGFNEMCRVLRPGGTALVTTWGPPERMELADLITASIKAAIPDFELTRRPPAMRFSDSEFVSSALREAGFAEIDVHTASEPWVLPSADSIKDLMISNPALADLRSQMSEKDAEAMVQAAVGILQDRFGDGQPTLSRPTRSSHGSDRHSFASAGCSWHGSVH